MTCWQILGIAPTSDEATIKQAYAACIREHRPDRGPEGFRRVRAAYEEALRQREFIRPRHEKKRRREADAPSTHPEPPLQNPLANSYYGYTATRPPEISEILREPANVAYLDRPTASERATAPHDYLDRPADARENPAALLARLQAAWEDATSDAALLAAVATILGFTLAFNANLPVSPAIIGVAGVLYFAVLIHTRAGKKPPTAAVK